MDELKIHDKVFPFVCVKCKKEYDLEGFTNVVLLWGFIYLTKGTHGLIGITCPDCYYTTLQKYSLNTPDFSMEALEKMGTVKRYYGDSGSIELNEAPRIKYYVPFSAKILTDLSLIAIPKLIKNENKEDSYSIPFGFEPRAYSKYVYDEYFILERIIPKLLEIENKERYRVFPRIVPFRSIYAQFDMWLIGLDKEDDMPADDMATIHGALSVLISVSYNIAQEPAKTA